MDFNVISVILSTVEGIYSAAPLAFAVFDRVSIAIFSIEYILRVWCSVENPRFQKPFSGRVRYMLTPLALIDLIAIAPLLVPFTGADLRSARTLRLLRMLRVFKFSRYSRGVHVMLDVLKKRKEELVATLGMLVTLLIVLVHSRRAAPWLVMAAGLACGPLFPTVLAILFLGFDGSMHGRALGTTLAIGNLGYTLTPLIVGLVARKTSVQRSFLVLSVSGIGLIAVAIALMLHISLSGQ